MSVGSLMQGLYPSGTGPEISEKDLDRFILLPPWPDAKDEEPTNSSIPGIIIIK